jgi:hypothetical protein
MGNIRTIYMYIYVYIYIYIRFDNFYDGNTITAFFKSSRTVSDEIRKGEHIYREIQRPHYGFILRTASPKRIKHNK